jgi:hypothetical protein
MADADAALDRVAPVSTAWALEYRGLLAALPYLPVDPARAKAARAALAQWDAAAAPAVPIATIAFSAHNGLHPMIRAYLVGILAADLGDTAAASRAAKALPALDATRAHAALSETLAGAIATEVSWARITEFYQWLIGSPFRAEARERFRRAQALAAAGQDTAAVRWYTSFETGAVDDVLYLAPSHLERARLYARLGRRALAAEHYRAFLALWRQCDPALRPVVAQAERELATVE